MMGNKKNIVVIGGGITGLSAAFELKKQAAANNIDVDCTVIEEDKRFGGKIKTHRENGLVMESGPDSLLARKPAGMQLIRELGLEPEMVGTNPSIGKTYIVSKGGLIPLPGGTNMGVPGMLRTFMQTKLISTAGKLRALTDFILPRETVTSDETLGTLLRSRLGDEVVELLCEPLMAGIYAGNIDQLSVQATFPDFQKMVNTERSLILASMRRFRNRPKPTNTGRSIFVTMKGGLETLPERMVEALKDTTDLRLNTKVEKLTRRADGTYDIIAESNGSATTIHADAVIITTPAPVAGNLLFSHIPSAWMLREIPYISTATVVIGYRKDTIFANLDASGFVVPRRENRAITASTWLSTKWPHTTNGEYVIIRCYVGRAKQQEFLNLPDDKMAEMVRSEIENLVGITAQPEFTKVTRWDRAMPQYLVNHLDNVRKVEQELATELPHVYIAGAGYRGIGIPDCIAQGRQAANLALSDLKKAE
jgi:protoporphyrinogen/coproporphyrinogen III oxidase